MKTEKLLATLFDYHESNNLQGFVGEYQPDIDMITELKAYSEKFYVTDPEQALQIAIVTHELSQHLPPPASALGSWAQANALIYNHRFHEANEFFAQTRSGLLAVGETLNAARASVGHVGILAYIGKCRKALALAQEIEPILEDASRSNLDDHSRLGRLLMNKGVAHELIGEYEEALSVYDYQIRITGENGNELLLGQLKHNRAFALAQISADDAALKNYAEAEYLLTKTDSVVDLIRLYTNQISLLIGLERYAEANDAQAKAEQRLRQIAGAEQQRHWLTLFKAAIALKRSIPIDATLLAALTNAQTSFAQHGSMYCEGLVWIVLGRCYTRRQEWDAAEHAFLQAQNLAGLGGARFFVYQALHGLGKLAHLQGDSRLAIKQYESAIHHIEAIRHELYVEVFRAGFLTDKLAVYQDLAAIYIEQQQLSAAFHVVEQAKARLLTDKLSFRLQSEAAAGAYVENSTLHTLMQALDEALQQLDEMYNQARLEVQPSAQAPAGVPQKQTTAQIEALEEKSRILVQTIQREQPLFSPFATGETVSIPTLQQNLPAALFLQYHVIDEKIGLFVIDHSGIREHLLIADLSAILAALDAVRNAIELAVELPQKFGPETFARFLPAQLTGVNKHLHTLYTLLLAPIQSHLNADIQLIIAPDGPLHHVPFHALFDGTRYAIESWAISYTPNATAFTFAQKPSTARDGTMLMGYSHEDLAAVAQELQTLSQLLPQADLYLEEAATTELFLTQAANYRVLHLATHAAFRMDDPMLSYLTLANRNLTLAEIARLHLEADLVALSGCETGQGQLRGADLLSLAGGFLGAGVHSLVVSLWRVEDNVTTEFMTRFYQALFAGQTRAAALRSAQRQILQQGRQSSGAASLYAHPAYWGPFILIGNPQHLSVASDTQHL